jgi:DNA helicase-2/ATP-dependent DNA helicase PcrA
MLDLSDLNANQRRAVEWRGSHLLVLAGPGSGKTKVLTLRVAKLIADSADEYFRVLGLTFTVKAATEMRERVDGLVGEGRERALLTTFHSFCADLLRQHGSHVGLRPDFAILTQDADREAVLHDAVAKLAETGLDTGDKGHRMLPVIDRLFADCVQDDDVAAQFQDHETGALAGALFAEYRRQLVSNNRLDFASLLYLTDQLLRERPQVGQHVQMVYPFICVDEFQDTNLAQYRVLVELSGRGSSTLFVVADDDQIIYQWNGASPERLEQLRTDFGMDVVQLPESYRCPGPVIELANNLIGHNLGRPRDKERLLPVKVNDSWECIRCFRFRTARAEAEWIAEDILKQPTSEHGECVVLGRTRKLLQEAVDVLDSRGVPAHLVERKTEFDTAPMRWLHAALRLANARHDREQLRRLCKSFHGIAAIDMRVEDVATDADTDGGDYLRAWCDRALERHELDSQTRDFVLKSVLGRLVDHMDYEAFVREAFTWVEGLERAERAPWEDAQSGYPAEKELWLQLTQDIQTKLRGQLSLNVLLQEMDLAPKTPPPPSRGGSMHDGAWSEGPRVSTRVPVWAGRGCSAVLPEPQAWGQQSRDAGGEEELLRSHHASHRHPHPDVCRRVLQME